MGRTEGAAAMYYFAYSSNMNRKQMEDRCPNARFVKRVYLEGYRFVYDGYSSNRGGAVANIVVEEAADAVVFGGLYEVDKSCLQSLDGFEGHPSSYKRQIVKVKDDQSNEFEAWVYLGDPQREGKPSSSYLKIVYEGAKDCGLPEDYIGKFINK